MKKYSKHSYDWEENLIQALIKQAYDDLYEALCSYEKNHDYKSWMTIHDCLEFFNSGWYAQMTKLPPSVLITRAIKSAKSIE